MQGDNRVQREGFHRDLSGVAPLRELGERYLAVVDEFEQSVYVTWKGGIGGGGSKAQ